MKTFIESIEITNKRDKEFIQEEVKDTDKKAIDKIKIKEKSGKTYKRRKHFCYHEEGLSCIVKDI